MNTRLFAQNFPLPQQLECFHRKQQLKNHSTETNREWEWIDETGYEWNSCPMSTQQEFNCTISLQRGINLSFSCCLSDSSNSFLSFFLTSCSLRRRVSHNSMSSRDFHKLSVRPWLTVAACSSWSRSTQFTWLRLAHLEITNLMTLKTIWLLSQKVWANEAFWMEDMF